MLNRSTTSTREDILSDVHNFVTETGISADALGRRAVGDGGVISRLRNGRNITIGTMDRLYDYMAHERIRRAEAGARRSTACHEGGWLSEAEAEDQEAARERSPSWRARFRAWFRS